MKRKTASSILGFDYILNVRGVGGVNVDEEIGPERARKLQVLSIRTGLSIGTILEKGIEREAEEKDIPFPNRKFRRF